ncbi:MAG: hypothetical protein AAF557_12980 [Pseudomonadota bacterium]
MTAHAASLLNAIVLIVCSAWAYLTAETASLTILIPAAFGIALIACYPGVKVENKVIAHIAVLLTLVVLVALVMPLSGAIGRGDGLSILRVAAMMITCVLAMIFFIKSFIDARRSREAVKE